MIDTSPPIVMQQFSRFTTQKKTCFLSKILVSVAVLPLVFFDLDSRPLFSLGCV